MKFLTFTLAGPLASYGGSDRWDSRGTEDMPTKSAVIGMLGCCLGYPRGDERLRRLGESLKMAVRRERRGTVLTDYQTVQSATGPILNTLGKPRGSTILTPKQYLQDAVFQVFLYGDETLLSECARAMRHPRWIVGLGRSSCPPSLPILPIIVSGECIEDVLKSWVDPAWERLGLQRDAQARCEADYSRDGDIDLGTFPSAYITTRQDEVIRADENRYGERRLVSMTIPVERSEKPCI